VLNEALHHEWRNGDIDPRILKLGTKCTYMCSQLYAPLALNFGERKAHGIHWVWGRVDLKGGLDSVERRREGSFAPAGSRTCKQYYLVIFFFLTCHTLLCITIMYSVRATRIIPVAVQKSIHRRKGGGEDSNENVMVLVLLCSNWHLMKNTQKKKRQELFSLRRN
jgi:hypothetical protein